MQINVKILSYVFLFCIVGLVAAIVYVAIAFPYGDLIKTKVYNLEVIQALMIPLTGFIGALLGILLTNKKSEEK